MIDKINSAIRATRVEICTDEEQGLHLKAVEKLDDLMILVKLRETYKSALDRVLI